MEDAIGAKPAPWHLWAVGILSLLWHAFGGYDYTMSQTRNREYMQMMTEPYGMDVDVALEYFDSFPLWADIAWAFGVWGAVAGSVLLLLRSRFAFHAFAVAMAGLIVSMCYTILNPVPGMTDSTVAMGFTVAIVVVTALLVLYAKRQVTNGVLR